MENFKNCKTYEEAIQLHEIRRYRTVGLDVEKHQIIQIWYGNEAGMI